MDRTTALTTALIFALALATSSSRAETPAPGSAASPGPHMHPGAGGEMCPAWRGGMAGEGPGGPWLSRLQDLGLTAEQRQAMNAVAERYRTRGVDLARRASGIREQLLSVSPDDPAYADATEKSSETAAVLAADTVRLVSELRAEVHALLTEEQRQRLREQGQKERQRWDDWRARHKAPQ